MQRATARHYVERVILEVPSKGTSSQSAEHHSEASGQKAYKSHIGMENRRKTANWNQLSRTHTCSQRLKQQALILYQDDSLDQVQVGMCPGYWLFFFPLEGTPNCGSGCDFDSFPCSWDSISCWVALSRLGVRALALFYCVFCFVLFGSCLLETRSFLNR